MQKDRRYWLRLLTLTLVALVVGVIGALVGLGLLASTRYVSALTHPGCGAQGLTPLDVGIRHAQAITYTSHDELSLRAWYLPPQNGAVIILLPGLGGSREGMLREGAILTRHGYGVLMTDLRSCAHPEGATTLGYDEAADLREAVTWVNDQPGVDQIGVLGYSLGGVTAILSAARDGRIRAVVAEGNFHDLTANTLNAHRDNHAWQTIIYRIIIYLFRRETGIAMTEISPISVIDQISPRPLLLIYGEHELVSTQARQLLAQAGEPKALWVVPDCGHGGYLNAAPEEWERRVVGFFDDALSSDQ